ncbi:MAG: haloacid dehalogenase-like hydrolase [Nitrospinales bacterium]
MNKQLEREIAIFDFDKTIISCDSAFYFIKSFIRNSPARILPTILLAPIGFILFYLGINKQACLSLLLWIGTVGLTNDEFSKRLETFTVSILDRPVRAKIFPEAIRKIEKYLASGYSVLIISASPQILVNKLISINFPNGLKIDIVGSEIKRFFGGFVYSNYCYHEIKVKMALKSGYDNFVWKSGYSDSSSDIPLLHRCQYRYLVNPDNKTIETFNKHFGKKYSILHW